MTSDRSTDQTMQQAQHLLATGRVAEAEAAFGQLAQSAEHREVALQSLAHLYLQTRRLPAAVDIFTALHREWPDNPGYCTGLANLQDTLGLTGAAVTTYEQFLGRNPGSATTYFNIALLYKKEKRFDDARNAYEKALELGIDDPQEVYSNLGVLYGDLHDAPNARAMYERALELAPNYLPALFNMAGFLEESGEREEAIELYSKILTIEPGHHESRARIIHAQRISSDDDARLADLRKAIAGSAGDRFGRETLQFALGKALDELGRYDEAFEAYAAANELARSRVPPYDSDATERAFSQLIDLFDANWIEKSASSSTFAPVFVCGLFRSGSTLTEQLLASHSEVAAGGELDLLPWLLARRFAAYPQGAAEASKELLQAVADEYQSKILELFPEAAIVTDKRPDNFLHLGLIKAMFPAARIIYTKRNPLDNCLSILFQQLGGALSYSTRLEDAAHYYSQHDRLMTHWQSCIGDSIHTVNYEDLVAEPEPVLRRLFEFLGLEWEEQCLDFTRSGNLVKTASVWQVRGELSSRSVERWRNYEAHLGRILDQFGTGAS